MANNTATFSTNLTTNSSECLILQYQDFMPWNNSDNIIQYETEVLVSKLRMLVILPLTFLIGVPANVINMVVFYKHGLKERINVCLFALSLADGLYLFVHMVTIGEQIYLHFTTGEPVGPFLEWLFNHYLLGFFGVQWVSQILSAIVACERCFCILQPLKSQTILRTSTMITTIVAVFIVVTGFRFIVVARYSIVCVYDPFSGKFLRTISGSKFYHTHRQLVDFLDIFVFGLVISWVVIVMVVSTTVTTVIKLRQASQWRAGMSSSSGNLSARDIALTRMLVANSTFFIVCVFPICLFRGFMLFIPEINAGQRYHNLFFLGSMVGHILSYINSTFNFVIYYTMGSRYRHTVHSLLGRKITKDAPNKTSVPTEKTVSTVN